METSQRVRLGLFAMIRALAAVEFAFALAFMVMSLDVRSVNAPAELILDFRVGQSSWHRILYCSFPGPCRAAPLPSCCFCRALTRMILFQRAVGLRLQMEKRYRVRYAVIDDGE